MSIRGRLLDVRAFYPLILACLTGCEPPGTVYFPPEVVEDLQVALMQPLQMQASRMMETMALLTVVSPILTEPEELPEMVVINL